MPRAWTDQEIVQFKAAFPDGSWERRAFCLCLYTKVRISDLVRLGPEHIRAGTLRFVDCKYRQTVEIPLTRELRNVLSDLSDGQETFLVNRYGEAMSRTELAGEFARACRRAGLPSGVSISGLIKTECAHERHDDAAAGRWLCKLVDRHGLTRWYFRRPGWPKVLLPGSPGSPQFQRAYARAVAFTAKRENHDGHGGS